MNEDRFGPTLEGITYEAALACINTLQKIHFAIAPKVLDIDFHLGRIADGTSYVADGIAIARNVNAIVRILDNILVDIDALGKAVESMKNREEAK